MSDFVLYTLGPVVVALGLLVVTVVAAVMALLVLEAVWITLLTFADRLVARARYERAWLHVHRGGRR